MSHARRVRRNPFRASAGWGDAPNVQFVWEGALDEVDERRIGRPQREVTVEPGRRSEDWRTLRSPVSVSHKQRISRSGRLVRESGTVMRPVELRHSFEAWPRLTPQRWHLPNTYGH